MHAVNSRLTAKNLTLKDITFLSLFIKLQSCKWNECPACLRSTPPPGRPVELVQDGYDHEKFHLQLTLEGGKNQKNPPKNNNNSIITHVVAR